MKKKQKMKAQPWHITAADLAKRGAADWPREFSQAEALIYSSPATLSYNSPGANGFGVKRAGLVLPESVMLLVSPGCCGRNSTILSRVSGYAERMFYLEMNETDLITGRHLKRIPDKIRQICDQVKPRPRAVMICITCVDALLGTDLERVCRKAEEEVPGVRVVPSYMYALTREGTRPPMTSIRKSLYSLLERKKVNPRAVNLMGCFAPLRDDSELYPLFREAGIRTICEISRMETLDQYMEMGEANFNLVLHPEARYAAEDLMKRLQMPYIELTRLCDPDKIAKQYSLFAAAVGISIDDKAYRAEAEEALAAFEDRYGRLRIVIGQMLNADPFELAAFFLKRGHEVPRIFAVPSEEDLPFIQEIAARSPETEIYVSTHPSMLADPEPVAADLALGRDARYFAPEAVHVPFTDDVQPFGYSGLRYLLSCISEGLDAKASEKSPSGAEAHPAKTGEADVCAPDPARNLLSGLPEEIENAPRSRPSEIRAEMLPAGEPSAGCQAISPFAPDISGAAEVLFGQGGVIVIIDAGGCTGNVCGFDEPRWFSEKSAVFSAGLRDLDAILGRDRKLIDKIRQALQYTEARFLALIGTPVPAVIGTDFRALKRMAEKEFGLPVLTIDANGMEAYEEGEKKAYAALLEAFPEEAAREGAAYGALPLEFPSEADAEAAAEDLLKLSSAAARAFGKHLTAVEEELRPLRESPAQSGDEPDPVDALLSMLGGDKLKINLALSPAGIAACEDRKRKLGMPYLVQFPTHITTFVLPEGADGDIRKVLVIHQAVAACAYAGKLEELLPRAVVETATFFEPLRGREDLKDTDHALKNEEDLRALVRDGHYDLIAADPILKHVFAGHGKYFLPLSHFAVSGADLNTVN